MTARDGSKVHFIPTAKPAWVLVDLAAVLDREALGRACHEAGVRFKTTPKQVKAVLARRPQARGVGDLQLVIGAKREITLSFLERRFVRLLRANGLPRPVTNLPAGSYRVDCRWPERRLTVELDSYKFHNSRYSWEQSYRREREARARGDEFRRFSYTDVVEDSAAMLAELRKLLVERSIEVA